MQNLLGCKLGKNKIKYLQNASPEAQIPDFIQTSHRFHGIRRMQFDASAKMKCWKQWEKETEKESMAAGETCREYGRSGAQPGAAQSQISEQRQKRLLCSRAIMQNNPWSKKSNEFV